MPGHQLGIDRLAVQPLLQVTDLTVRFGGLTALDSVNFAIKRGEIPASTSLETVLEITPAVITFRLFMSHQSVNRKFIEHFVDDVLLPVLIHSTK